MPRDNVEILKGWNPKMYRIGDFGYMVDADVEYVRLEIFNSLLAKTQQHEEYAPKHFKSCPYPDKHRHETYEGACFDKAKAMSEKHGYHYVEGVVFVYHEGNCKLTMGHAWCADNEGNIIDPTYIPFQNLSTHIYVGWALQDEFLARMRSKYDCNGVMDGNPDGTPDGMMHEPPETWVKKEAFNDTPT